MSRADVDVPRARLADASARARGRALFRDHCALCHGVNADGHGPRRSALSAPPANFRSPVWRARATPEHLFAVLRDGVPRSSMPSWAALPAGDRWDIVAYLLALEEDGP